MAEIVNHATAIQELSQHFRLVESYHTDKQPPGFSLCASTSGNHSCTGSSHSVARRNEGEANQGHLKQVKAPCRTQEAVMATFQASRKHCLNRVANENDSNKNYANCREIFESHSAFESPWPAHIS
jgi:hypothetical protein